MEKTVYYSGLVFFPTIVIKYLDKNKLRGKGLILAYHCRGLQPTMAGMTWQQAGAGWSHCIYTQEIESEQEVGGRVP